MELWQLRPMGGHLVRQCSGRLRLWYHRGPLLVRIVNGCLRRGRYGPAPDPGQASDNPYQTEPRVT